MEKIENFENEEMRGQAEIWQHLFAYVDSMALKCAVQLGIADVINSHGHPITLSEIANNLNPPSTTLTGLDYLSRIMQFLVRKRVFSEHPNPMDGGETLYGLTPSSKWILKDAEFSLAPMVLAQNHPYLATPWNYLSKCLENGGTCFGMVHGKEIWELAKANEEFNKMFNQAMACTAKITVEAMLSSYKDGFNGVGSIVDVGGGTGNTISGIVKAYPHLHGINFDLPHVLETAPDYSGVEHVGGDMFAEVPKADMVLMKWIMHDWNDRDCIKILKNCKKAIPENTGKIAIIDAVLQPKSQELFSDTRMVFDLVMLTHSNGGKERTEAEWKMLLEEAGFPRYKIIQIPYVQSVIEAYPE